MEYVCLILQIILIFETIFFSPNDRYLVNHNECYKKYLFVELIAQGLCVIINCVLIFVIKRFMVYVLGIHIILMSVILIIYSRKAKKRYFNELINIIKENNLLLTDAKEIKNYLLKKYGQIYFIDDIEKCLLKINK